MLLCSLPIKFNAKIHIILNKIKLINILNFLPEFFYLLLKFMQFIKNYGFPPNFRLC